MISTRLKQILYEVACTGKLFFDLDFNVSADRERKLNSKIEDSSDDDSIEQHLKISTRIKKQIKLT